jgi:small subunit ribosomal protein S26e
MAINQVVIPGRLAKKRKSSGRAKGGAGHKGTVDKAKKYTKMSSSVEPQIARELRQQGSYIPSHRVTAYYCVSCAVHSGKVHIRDTRMRKSAPTH